MSEAINETEKSHANAWPLECEEVVIVVECMKSIINRNLRER